ncbi:MAG TPA: sugar-binding protein, partial [Gemmatimonadaceae bacterium]
MSHVEAISAMRSARKTALTLMSICALARGAQAQALPGHESEAGQATSAILARASASQADHPPVIDGRDDDAIWKTAAPITGFRVFDPKEDGDPSAATEARVAYDAENLYVFTRMFDTHPDSILSL